MWTRRGLLAAGIAAAAGPAWPVEPPTSAHAQALTAAARLQARADRLLAGQGLRRGSVAERLRRLAKDERYLYQDSDAGRDQAVADMNARLAALRPRLALAFGDLKIPPAEVRRMSPADEAKRRAGYRDQGAYYVDLADILGRPAWTLPSVAFHETIPGHALQASAPGPQDAAFAEGWATYAEALAADLGAYAHDLRGEIGSLQWRLFRLARIVVDTGMNGLGWSRDQALAAMYDLQGQSIAFITVEADVARMAERPGQYAAQGLVALAIERARPRSRQDWPAFHRRVLERGI